ncbi:hypothetical protein G3I60_33175 [Streptomyces sp. SID13666]|uniref:hypothetical protein n=1 Tax=unclassified Streptomyces TaxID=2593676 RepID=UPI0013C1771A|nr:MULTISPECIES: hypothetical protein [unclassified Streptomyces]NEA58878.1 hypothetical protein [Streptomyces sp. SID13666]NEA72938.1 hypothetical protein [Streptomyces sp. SID13588]
MHIPQRIAGFALLAPLLLVTACSGSSGGDTAGASTGPGATTPAVLPARTALERTALVPGDVPGFTVTAGDAAGAAADATAADKRACQPLADLLSGRPPAGAKETVPRALAPAGQKMPGAGVTVTLSAYGSGGAQKAVAALRTAVHACAAGFKPVIGGVTGVPVAVAPRPALELGDDDLRFALGFAAGGSGARQDFVVIRTRSTVSIFRGADVTLAKSYDVPPAVVTAQLKKLGAPVTKRR